MARKKFIAGNWKMNMTASEGAAFAEELVGAIPADDSVRVLVAPPFTTISAVAQALSGSRIIIGAQNMSDNESGAHTGEISPAMLLDLGVAVVILGHSERRMIYGEDDTFINRKVTLALKHGLEVILCVGETLEERENGTVEQVVREQLTGGLQDVPESALASITIAYEPVWAIGTGRTATPEDADAVHGYIRRVIADTYTPAVAEELVIQYGGSVKPENASELLGMENIDGALVGGASLKVDSFSAIVAAADTNS